MKVLNQEIKTVDLLIEYEQISRPFIFLHEQEFGAEIPHSYLANPTLWINDSPKYSYPIDEDPHK